jgi:hypothetical protein
MTDIPLLAGLYPRARFVHLVRDPRDCVLSTQDAWGNSPVRTAQEWADRVRACRAAGAAVGPSRFLELRYEDLVSDVRGCLAGVFEFLGVPTPPDAGQFLRVPENLGSARSAGEVMTRNRQKWKQSMSLALRRRVEGVTGELLDAYGYEREHPEEPTRRVPAVHMAAYRLKDTWRQLQFRRKEQGGWLRGLRFLLAR